MIKTKSNLLTIQDAAMLTKDRYMQLFRIHINNHLGKLMAVLGLADRKPVKAVGSKIYFDDGTEATDFTAQVGVCSVGHNHPRILEVRRKWAEAQQLEVWKLLPSPYQAALARNISEIFNNELDVVFYCNSGAEANEGALKMAEKYTGKGRRKIVYTDISFHGKTHATLAVSGSEKHQNRYFKLPDNCVEIPYGNADAFEQVLKANGHSLRKTEVAAFIVEAVRAESVVIPPAGYFKRIRELCDKYDVVLIVDEVYTGFGRTGKMFAIEHHGILPDICTFSKAFGAGKATFSGFAARARIFRKAYGRLEEATLHSTTYSGFGEEIVTAMELIHILYDEGLIENSEKQGRYLLESLTALKNRHPDIIREVRGIGLLASIRFENIAMKLTKVIPGFPENLVAKLTTGIIISELFEKHNILVFTPPHHFDTLLLSPPLVITEQEIDALIDALDKVVRINFLEAGRKYLARYLSH